MIRYRQFLNCLLLTMLFMTFDVPGHSQSSEKTRAITVSATILPEIQLMTIRDINMMDVAAEGDALYISPLTDVNAGLMLALGQPDALIRLNYLRRLEMVRSDGPGQLIINYEVSLFSEDNQRASRLFDSIDEALRFSSEGKLYIWVGGRIDLSSAYPGNYEGEFTIEIEYI